jgi:hypothetical protein
MPAPNKQFATSGGVTRPNGSAEQHLLALVRAFVIPPPSQSRQNVACNPHFYRDQITSIANEVILSKEVINLQNEIKQK